MLDLKSQRVFGGSTFDLRNKRLSIDSALDGDVVDARFTGYRVVFAIDFDDGSAVTSHGIVYFNLGVLMGAIGSRNRLEYSAVGDTVNVASRLEHLARAHDASIVASAETLAAAVNSGSFAVADSKRFRPVGAVQVPGRGEPVEVFIVPAFEAGGR